MMWKWIAIVVVVLVVGVGVYLARPIVYAAGIATEYVARRSCMCVFVSGRTLPACIAEMPQDVSGVEAEVIPEQAAIRAHISFIAERTARYDGGSACTVE
jgi:hypothetical protein